MCRAIVALQELLRLVGGDAPLALQILAEATRADGDVAREDRDAVVEDVDVRDVVADVDEGDDATHGFGIVDFEGVVEREGVDVHHAGLEARIGEHAQLRFDQLALRRDEQHVHLDAVVVGIEDLEVQLHRLHVERHVLLRFPAHQLARLLLLHALDLDLLDDHVAAADGGHDVLALDVGGGERALNRFRDDARVHHFAFDDGVGEQWHDGDLDQLRLLLGVIDDRDLDESRPDVQADRGFLATEQ